MITEHAIDVAYALLCKIVREADYIDAMPDKGGGSWLRIDSGYGCFTNEEIDIINEIQGAKERRP